MLAATALFTCSVDFFQSVSPALRLSETYIIHLYPCGDEYFNIHAHSLRTNHVPFGPIRFLD